MWLLKHQVSLGTPAESVATPWDCTMKAVTIAEAVLLLGSGCFVFFFFFFPLKKLNYPWSFPGGLHPLPPGARVVLGSTRVGQTAAFARGPWWNLSLLKTMQQKSRETPFSQTTAGINTCR